ncbi:hypothetical protein NM688_g6158 [Phlebia brevispora]|uniref:Uncharacterized protein n=1 Tax=Phlebia brevispora TaxID=194682 RepID=A0ACC1SJB9_9APHY|nr:hypothetical protein NM688_g6158 [Phlebia brevispora]
MQREWTERARNEWIARRTERRKQQGRPNPHSPRDSSLESERKGVRDSLKDIMAKSAAWELQKHPLAQYPAPFSGKLYLPLRHADDDRIRTIKFKAGEDLNLLVYCFYNAETDSNFSGVNFVSADKVVTKRHEYLGPAPYVSGYRFDSTSKTARIEWWDPYLKLMWIGRETWKFEVYFDEQVGGWVSRPRGDFDEALDTKVSAIVVGFQLNAYQVNRTTRTGAALSARVFGILTLLKSGGADSDIAAAVVPAGSDVVVSAPMEASPFCRRSIESKASGRPTWLRSPATFIPYEFAPRMLGSITDCPLYATKACISSTLADVSLLVPTVVCILHVAATSDQIAKRPYIANSSNQVTISASTPQPRRSDKRTSSIAILSQGLFGPYSATYTHQQRLD